MIDKYRFHQSLKLYYDKFAFEIITRCLYN